MYVVVNRRYGGFGLSVKGAYHFCQKKYGQAYVYKCNYFGEDKNCVRVPYSDDYKDTLIYWVSPEDHNEPVDVNDIKTINNWDIERNDPALVATVRELGEEANGECADLEIVEIPDDVKWHIEEYDGMESIHEDHRSW